MNVAIAGLIVWLSSADLPAGTELQYAGTLNQQTKNGPVEVKSFTFYTVTTTDGDGGAQQAWFLNERGGGGWGWPERFGLISSPPAKGIPIRLLYSHENQQYALPIRSPLFEFRDKLVPQSSWVDGRAEYVVTRKRKVQDRDCFQVEVSSNLGRLQTLAIDAASGILVSLDERVIIGRGDEFQLKMELQSQNQLAAAEIARSRQILDSLIAIQSGLNRTGEQKAVELTEAQLKSLQTEFPRIEKEAEGTGWFRFVASIGRDLQQQQKRLEGVAGFEKKLVGKPAPKWTLKLTDGKSISDSDLKDTVVVIHFWQYRGEPLTEPYGQVGYLDFLNSNIKRRKLNVRVIGVNVDERFANPDQSAAANRSMKGLMEFMKLAYDIAVDDGSTLAEFGDPRTLGAPLPLWIVIGHDGVVTHYHTGIYNIKPDEGLKQLDEAIIEAVRRQKKK